MTVRSLLAAGCVAAAAAVAVPTAEATGPVGYDPCCVPVVVNPCCQPPELSHRERKAARRIARLERRQDRIRDRAFADDCCGSVGYGGGYGYAAPSYGHASPGIGRAGYGGFGGVGYGGYGYGY